MTQKPTNPMLDALFATVEWHDVPPPTVSSILYATHWGVLKVLDQEMHVYQLNDGQRIIDAEDFATFLRGLAD